MAGDTVVYGVSTVLGRFLNYLLVPLHTSLFFPDQLAPQVQLYVYAAVSYTLLPLGLETAFFRFAAKENDRQQYYNLILSAVILMSVICTTPIFIFSEEIAEFIHYPQSGMLVRWFAVIMALQGISTIPSAKMRLEGRGKKFAWIAVINIVTNILLNLFFLVLCRDINAGKYLSFLKPLIDLFYFPEYAPNYIILSTLMVSVLCIFLLRKEFTEFRFTFNKQIFKPVWVYAFPVLIVNLAGVLSTLYDRAVMQFLLPHNFYPGRTTKEAIGIYGVCSQLAGFMNMAIQAFKYAAEPFFFSKGIDKNAPEVFARIMKYFIIVCCIMWVGVSINLDILAKLFLRQDIYHEGLSIVPWQLAGFLFLGVYYNLTTWFKLSDKTQYGTYFAVLGTSVTLIASYVLVPVYGYLGFASAFAASGFIMMAACYIIGQRYFYIPYHLKSATAYIVSAGLIIYISSLFQFANLLVSVSVHLATITIFTVFTLAVERKALMSFLAKPKKQELEYTS